MSEHNHPDKKRSLDELSEEFISELKKADTADISPGLPGDIVLSESTPEEIEGLLQSRITSLGPTAFVSRILIPGTYENLLYHISTANSTERLRLAHVVSNMSEEERAGLAGAYNKEHNGEPRQIGDSSVGGIKGKGRITSENGGAAVMLSSRGRKSRRVHLLNSGFSVDIRVPDGVSLSELLSKCRIEADEYGRRIGAVYYAYFDLILSQYFTEMVISLVETASLKNWEKPGVLVQAIKLQDRPHLMLSMLELMYQSGWNGFRHICARPQSDDHPTGCSHVEEKTISFSRLKKSRFTKLSSDSIRLLSKSRNPLNKVDQDHIDEYQKSLGYDGTVITHGDWEFVMRTPSLADHSEAGDIFNKDVLNGIDAKNRLAVRNALAFRKLRMFLPSIHIARTVTTDSLDEGSWTDEKEVIADILDGLSRKDAEDGNPLASKFTKFMDDSQLTLIGYTIDEPCPACGYYPETTFVPVDVEGTFFTLALQILGTALSATAD